MVKAKDDDLIISVPGIPGGNAVDYQQFLEIPISVLNRSKDRIVVDAINLRFQAEWNLPGCDAMIEHKCPGFEIAAGKEEYRKVRVQPTPLFMEASNYFDVALIYKKVRAPGEHSVKVRPNVTYVVINLPPASHGQAFISYKDPEDADLKNIMKTVARRVGIIPYVAPDDARPGTTIWDEKIPPAVKSSALMFVLWTNKTEFGTGVRKEIALAKKLGVKLVPLIEATAPVPSELQSHKIEFARFERQRAPADFSKVALACLEGHT